MDGSSDKIGHPAALKSKKYTNRDICMPKFAEPVKITEKEKKVHQNYPILVKESDNSVLKRLDPEKLVGEKVRKNKYCLPTEKEMQRRKKLFAEFDRMHNLAQETCDWLIAQKFPVTNNDRRNLAALMKTCFDPLPFSSIGKKPKEVMLVLQERDATAPKPFKFKEREPFKYISCDDHVGSTLREYIKKKKKYKLPIINTEIVGDSISDENSKEVDSTD